MVRSSFAIPASPKRRIRVSDWHPESCFRVSAVVFERVVSRKNSWCQLTCDDTSQREPSHSWPPQADVRNAWPPGASSRGPREA